MKNREMHVCVLQTSFAKRDDTVKYLTEKVPDLRVSFITDDTILADVKANGEPDKAVFERMTLYAMAAERMGADVILNSCSTVGEVADAYAKVVNIPVVKIDEAMAEEAVEAGEKLALIATVETTLSPSQKQLENAAAKADRQVKIDQYLEIEAWNCLSAGDSEGHNRILLEKIRDLAEKDYDAIVMAQVSMRALLPELKGVKKPVFCSFYSGLDRVVQKLQELKEC